MALLELIAYLLSGVMLGMIAFIVTPALAGGSKHGHRLGYYYALLAFATVRRPVIRVGEHLDLSFSKAVHDSKWNAEKPNGSDSTAYEDPGVWHRLKSYPLAFGDDAHGFLFDIKAAAIGSRIEAARERGDFTITNGADHRYYRAFFEFPRRSRELVNLAHIRTAVTGNADSALADRVDDYYEKSQAKRGSAMGSLKLLFPLAGLAAGFGLMWVAASQGAGGGGGGGGRRDVDVGILGLLVAGASAKELLSRLQDAYSRVVEWFDAHPRAYYATLGATGFLGAVIACVLFIVLLGVVPVVLMTIGFVAGVVMVPAVAWALGPMLGGLGIMLATGILSLAFWAYDRPVFDQVDATRYELREARNLGIDVEENTTWFRLCWSWVGFTFNAESCLESAAVDPDTVEAYADPLATDGGEAAGVPRGYAPTQELPRANGQWQGYVPMETRDSKVYALYTRAASVMRDIATGHISDRAYRVAKKKYGAGGVGDNDTLILLSTAALAVLGAGFGYVVFFA